MKPFLFIVAMVIYYLSSQTVVVVESCWNEGGSEYSGSDFDDPNEQGGETINNGDSGNGSDDQPPITPDPNADMTDPSEPCQQDGTDGCEDDGAGEADGGGGEGSEGLKKAQKLCPPLRCKMDEARKSKKFAAAMLKPGKEAKITSPPLDALMEEETNFRIYILSSSADVQFESCCDDACESMKAGKPKKWTKAVFKCKKDTEKIAIKCKNDGSEEAACALDLLTVLNPESQNKDACWVPPGQCKDAKEHECDKEKAGNAPARN